MRLPRRRPAPAPAPAVVRTHVEVDLSELNVTPTVIEPSAYCQAVALNNAGMFMAYLRAGFDREEAFELLTIQLEAALYEGKR